MLNGVNIGAEQVGSTLHWGPYWPYGFFKLFTLALISISKKILNYFSNSYNGYEKTTWPKNSSPGYNKDFHLYQLEWTPST